MRKPLRFWRTGTVAVVLAALGGAGFADDASSFGETSLQCMASPFDVDETVHRIGVSARQRGMPVFACVEQRGGGARIARGAADADAARVVVLESAEGGTPVLMAADGSDGGAIALPLSIHVHPDGDGHSEVWVEAPQRGAETLPGLNRDLAVLDAVVRDALRA